MKYVYPKLSRSDLFLFRLRGSGLGNLLFPYSRALVYSKKNNIKMIYPTWGCLNLGSLKGNKNRHYFDLFRNKSKYISGLKKCWLLLTSKKISEKEVNFSENNNVIIEYYGMGNLFNDILYDSEIIKDDIIKNLQNKNEKACRFIADNSICVHIRLGDFSRATEEQLLSGQHNSSIPIYWFVDIINQLREIIGYNVKVYVFSDGTKDELSDVLKLDNIELITFGTSIADIIALSKASLFIASGSSFSMWVRYLGRMNTIMYINQSKQRILTEKDETFEIEVLNTIPNEYHDRIKKIYNKSIA